MRILVATDAWHPQINGVVRTYERIAEEARHLGVELVFLSPSDFSTVRLPFYPEIRLALPQWRRAARFIDKVNADYVHIATEGPVGLMARAYCRRRKVAFTTSYHTRFPEYVAAHLKLPEAWSYAGLRWFHHAGLGVMVATRSLAADLAKRGFRNSIAWTRGVDTDQFRPRPVRLFGTEKPVFLYVGRVSAEKNIEAFLALDLPGRKIVVGDGPSRHHLAARYPDVVFTGPRTGEGLAECYASADVFVFPSRTDTFGLVIIEAMASGLPVAAYPVMGPVDIVRPGVSGVLSEDLQQAAIAALALPRGGPRQEAMQFSWQNATQLFLDNIEAVHRKAAAADARLMRRRRRRSRLARRLAAMAHNYGWR